LPGFIELLKFDNNTGFFSNPIFLNSVQDTLINSSVFYENKLYVLFMEGYNNIYYPKVTLIQYNISNWDSLSIVNSKQILYQDTIGYLYTMQNAPDGNIYIGDIASDSMSIINDPNLSGSACNFQFRAFKDYRACGYGITNFIDSYFYTGNNYTNIKKINTITNNINIYPNPANTIITLRINKNLLNNQLIIYNAYGTKIKTMYLRETSSNIDVSMLEKGLYFLSVIDNYKQKYLKKIIIY
jgi:hypothetical protein